MTEDYANSMWFVSKSRGFVYPRITRVYQEKCRDDYNPANYVADLHGNSPYLAYQIMAEIRQELAGDGDKLPVWYPFYPAP